MTYFSTLDDFVFTRKISIKNLFNPQGVFAQFSDITFLSFASFSAFIKANLFSAPSTLATVQQYHIRVSSREEIETLLQIIEATRLDKRVVLTLHYGMELLSDICELVTDQKIELSTTGDVIQSAIDNQIEYPKVSSWIEYTMTASNYAKLYEEIIKRWLADPRFSLLDLNFDYVSFEQVPIEGLKKLYFYMNMFRLWLVQPAVGSNESSSGSCSDAPVSRLSPLTLRNRVTPIRCYVDDELNIRLNESEVYFPMGQFLGKIGEDLSQEELNAIRKIIDIKFEKESIDNWYLVDLDQNFKIMGDHYQIPFITKLICEWLGQSH